MSTRAQRRANRRNAQKSTGPTSVAGKAASSRNALKSGLYSKCIVLPSESYEEFNELAESFDREYQPVTPQARALVDCLIRNTWLLDRYRQIQFDLLHHEDIYKPIGEVFQKVTSQYLAVSRLMASAERAIERHIKLLMEPAINEPAAEAPSTAPQPVADTPIYPEIGFVSANRREAPHQSPAPGPGPLI